MPTSPSPLQFAMVDYSACETGRKVAKVARCTFAVAMECVQACGGDYTRALAAARKLRAEGRIA